MKEKKQYRNNLSLYDAFELGDRVKRTYLDMDGIHKELKGIVLAINKNEMEIYWDTVNGKYRPDQMDFAFTNCSIDEIFEGSEKYSPIKKVKNY